MASAAESLYSGTPESKGTLYTPILGPFDEYFPPNTPSDLRLSPAGDSYGEWSALPSRLLDSPPREQVSGLFHSSSSYVTGADGKSGRKPSTQLNNEDGVEICHQPCVGNSTDDFKKMATGSLLHPPVAGRFLDPTSKNDRGACQSFEGSFTHQAQSNGLQDQAEWTASPTRHMMISSISAAISFSSLYRFLQEIGDVQEFYTKKLVSDGFCVVSYFDLRDAMTACKRAQGEQNWKVQFCSSTFVAALNSGDDSQTSQNAGGSSPPSASGKNSEVVCIICSGGRPRNTSRVLYHVLSEFGAISKFTCLENTRPPTYLISFFDAREASEIVDTLDGQYIEGFHLKVSFYDSDFLTWNRAITTLRTRRDEKGRSHVVLADEHDMDIYCPKPIRPSFDFSVRRGSTGSIDSMYAHDYDGETSIESMYSGGYVTPQRPKFAPSYSHSSSSSNLMGAPCCPLNTRYSHDSFKRLSYPNSAMGTPSRQISGANSPIFHADFFCQGQVSPPLGIERFSNQLQVPGKNMIDLDRILHGLDTRTTVMLRNIPNKVDQQTLKEYVDTTSKGLYNFLYLRIDFRNICNVGYAFINFIDPLDIVDVSNLYLVYKSMEDNFNTHAQFVKAKSGTRWNKFNSEKVLDVTYANIQGIDQLVEKFRNSSVMDQDPAYRPKLFHSSGPFAGTEMNFPAANNVLKKCRSISAAQQIGLFAPKLSTTGKGIWRKRE